MIDPAVQACENVVHFPRSVRCVRGNIDPLEAIGARWRMDARRASQAKDPGPGSTFSPPALDASEATRFERYRQYLHVLAEMQIGPHLARKVDASDVVQETFLRAAKRL